MLTFTFRFTLTFMLTFMFCVVAEDCGKKLLCVCTWKPPPGVPFWLKRLFIPMLTLRLRCWLVFETREPPDERFRKSLITGLSVN